MLDSQCTHPTSLPCGQDSLCYRSPSLYLVWTYPQYSCHTQCYTLTVAKIRPRSSGPHWPPVGLRKMILWCTMMKPLDKETQIWTRVSPKWTWYSMDWKCHEHDSVCQTFSPHSKGCDKAPLADKICCMSYLSAQSAVVLDLGSKINFLHLILTRIRDVICFHLGAYDFIYNGLKDSVQSLQSKVFGLKWKQIGQNFEVPYIKGVINC